MSDTPPIALPAGRTPLARAGEARRAGAARRTAEGSGQLALCIARTERFGEPAPVDWRALRDGAEAELAHLPPLAREHANAGRTLAETEEDRSEAPQDRSEALGAFSAAAAAASGAGWVAALTLETALVLAWVKRTERRAEARAAKRFERRLQAFLPAPAHPKSVVATAPGTPAREKGDGP